VKKLFRNFLNKNLDLKALLRPFLISSESVISKENTVVKSYIYRTVDQIGRNNIVVKIRDTLKNPGERNIK
jgi:hypothetical protein